MKPKPNNIANMHSAFVRGAFLDLELFSFINYLLITFHFMYYYKLRE
jgi:hypothetical protein